MSLPAPDVRAKAAEELLGQTLSGRFRLDAILGHGAMGVVYKAYHTGLQKDVALKLLHPELTANEEMVKRFDREAAAVSRLDHPNCVRIMDFGSTDDGRRYLVMEYLEGKDLADVINDEMPPFRVAELIRQVLEGLAHAHAQGLVHRDIKPENIFVLDGKDEHVKLLDFGIAKVSHGAGAGQLTQAGMVFGTPHYMSPEQARGEKIDARSDLYALGVVMYGMLAAKLPFHADDPVVLLRQQIKEKPPALPDSVPASLRRFVMQLLAKKPEDRFPDAATAAAALRRAASPTKPPAKPKLPPPPRIGRPGGLPKPKPPTVGNAKPKQSTGDESPTEAFPPVPEDEAEQDDTMSESKPEAADTELPALEELVALEADEEPEAQPEAPPPPPPKPQPAPPPPPASAAQPEERPPWLLPAAAAGALALIMLIVWAWPDGDDAEGESEVAAVEDGSIAEDAEKTDDEAADEADAPEELVLEDDAADPEPAADEGEAEPKSERALRATIASIDALIESKEYDAARITLGPLLEVYADEPELHWRMGQVLVALGRKANATAALESYRSALALKPALLDDETFSTPFWELLDDPRHRELSATIAIELLGARGHERLARWVNVQKGPLPYASRQAVTEHLRVAGQAQRINEPLQTALDLWQAGTAEAPCNAFERALEAATEHPDSYLLGSLSQVTVPQTGDGEEATACPGLAESLSAAQEDYAQRYAGFDPIVPAAYRRRKGGQSKNRRRRR
jgi:serine/threonine protein kinase